MTDEALKGLARAIEDQLGVPVDSQIGAPPRGNWLPLQVRYAAAQAAVDVVDTWKAADADPDVQLPVDAGDDGGQQCATCKHWDKAAEAPHARTDDEGYVNAAVSGEWGGCERIQHLGIQYLGRRGPLPYMDERTDDPAYLSDGSGYFASLTTRGDFGCALHEARSGSPQ